MFSVCSFGDADFENSYGAKPAYFREAASPTNLERSIVLKGLWAGLDVGVETTSVCVINDAGETVHEATCASNAKAIRRELAALRRRRLARVGMESGQGIALARGLRTLGFAVDIYEARQLSKFLRMRRNKTDAGDAHGIAQAVRLGAPLISKVHLKSVDCQSILSRLTIRRHLVRARVRANNLLCRQIEWFGGRLTTRISATAYRSDAKKQIRVLFSKTQNPVANELLNLLDHCQALYERQLKIDRDLRQLALQNDVCRRFMTIPGVGPICALTFYAVIEEPHRFSRSSTVGAFLGLTPRIHQSGLSKICGRISRMGSNPARAVLFQSAMKFMSSTKSPECTVRQWALQVAERRGRGKAKVAMARKLATIMLAMWKSGDDFQAVVRRPPAPSGSAEIARPDLDRTMCARQARARINEAGRKNKRLPLGPLGAPLFYLRRRGPRSHPLIAANATPVREVAGAHFVLML